MHGRCSCVDVVFPFCHGDDRTDICHTDEKYQYDLDPHLPTLRCRVAPCNSSLSHSIEMLESPTYDLNGRAWCLYRCAELTSEKILRGQIRDGLLAINLRFCEHPAWQCSVVRVLS